MDPSVEKPSVDKIAKSQKNPASNTLPQRKDVVDNSLLIVEPTTAKPKSISIISNSKEHIRQTNIKYNAIPYVPKKEVRAINNNVPNIKNLYSLNILYIYTKYFANLYYQSESLQRRSVLIIITYLFSIICFNLHAIGTL